MRLAAVAGSLVLTLAFAAAAQTRDEAPSYPRAYPMTTKTVGKWAVVLRRVAVHARPNRDSRVVTMLKPVTYDKTQNLVLIISGLDSNATHAWYRVQLPIRPNNSTGWVKASALGDIRTVHTHLYVNRKRLVLTLKRNGKTILTAPVSVGGKRGAARTPTPAGEFYIVDKLVQGRWSRYQRGYGPVAFGTSAHSPGLKDWPGGGVVGIYRNLFGDHVSGRVTLGGIWLKARDMRRLAKLLPVGTPLTIR